jgi:hypothetical protein
MQVEHLKKYKARFQPQRTDDLCSSVLPFIGQVFEVQSTFKITSDEFDENCDYIGQYAMAVMRGPLLGDRCWAPEEDWEILEEVPNEE